MNLDPSILGLLNRQLTLERTANATYLALAAWCDANGYTGSSARFAADADEEYSHAKRVVAYLQDRATPTLTALAAPPAELAGLPQCYAAALNLERSVSTALQQLIDAARSAADEATAQFASSLLAGQVSSEKELQTVLLQLKDLTPGEVCLWDGALIE